MLNKIEEGSGIKMTLLVNGNPEVFNLAVLRREGWKDENYEYGFVNESWTKYFRNPYSGGRTGFGCNVYDIKEITDDFKKEYKIITTDLDCITALANADEVKAKLDEEEFTQNQEAKVKAINALPKTFSPMVDAELDSLFEFVRSDAEYKRHYSSSVKGGSIQLRKIGEEKTIWLDNYTTKDGKLRIKNFAGNMKRLFGEMTLRFEPKTLLSKLIERQKELTQMVKMAK